MAAIFAAFGISAGVFACGSSVSGTPNADSKKTENSANPTASDRRPSLAPSVSKALNIGPYLHVKNICYIIGDEQAKRVGFDEPHATKRALAGGPVCGISDRGDGDNNLDIGLQKHFSLDDAYAHKDDWSYFKTDSVEGYPIVFGTADDDRGTGTCVVHVGVTNQITSDIMYTENATESGDKACHLAKKTASEVVTTLKKTK